MLIAPFPGIYYAVIRTSSHRRARLVCILPRKSAPTRLPWPTNRLRTRRRASRRFSRMDADVNARHEWVARATAIGVRTLQKDVDASIRGKKPGGASDDKGDALFAAALNFCRGKRKKAGHDETVRELLGRSHIASNFSGNLLHISLGKGFSRKLLAHPSDYILRTETFSH